MVYTHVVRELKTKTRSPLPKTRDTWGRFTPHQREGQSTGTSAEHFQTRRG
ncbi:MAG: hypothetical protein ACQESR_06465 [Planctomycetota bacterium]